MPTISAANSLSIEIEGNTWKLFNGRIEDATRPIIDATTLGMAYHPSFGTARRLPAENFLRPDQVGMVVVGWAAEDTNWHLGLMLSPEAAQVRGGRWCELARWPNEDGDQAERAGKALSDTLGRSFKLVPPPARTRPREDDDAASDEAVPLPAAPVASSALPSMPAAATAGYTATSADLQPGDLTVPTEAVSASQADVPTMPLPIAMGEWVLKDSPMGLVWERARSWWNETLIRAIFFAVLTLAFGALSLGSRLTVFAPVQPEWLPLAGIAVALVMLVLTFIQLIALLRAPTTLVDNRVKIVRQSYKGSRSVTQSPFEGIEYLLVSHIINRREPAPSTMEDAAAYDRILAEVWIHLYSPRRGFINLAYIGQIEGRARSNVKITARQQLRLSDIDTPAHHAAFLTAREMGIPAFCEERK